MAVAVIFTIKFRKNARDDNGLSVSVPTAPSGIQCWFCDNCQNVQTIALSKNTDFVRGMQEVFSIVCGNLAPAKPGEKETPRTGLLREKTEHFGRI